MSGVLAFEHVEVAGTETILDAIRKANLVQLAFARPTAVIGTFIMHKKLVRAIATGNPDAAEREMRRHLRRARGANAE